MRIYRRYVITLIAFLIPSLCKAQGWDYSYTHFGKNEGLPSNKIYFVCTDHDGFLWIGTDAGLCQYDGNHFEWYSTEDGLPSNDVFELICDSHNRLWIITMSKEVSYYYRGKIYNAKNSKLISSLKKGKSIARILEDKFHTIWIIMDPFVINTISANGQVEQIDTREKYGYAYRANLSKDGVMFFTPNHSVMANYINHDLSVTSSPYPKFMHDINIDQSNVYTFIGTDNKLHKGKDISSPFDFYTNSHALTLFSIGGHYLLLSNLGVRYFDTSSLIFQGTLLKNYPVSNIVEDKYKNLWIATLFNGLYKVNNINARNFKPNIDEASNAIHSLLVTDTTVITGNNNGEICIIGKKSNTPPIRIRLPVNSALNFRVLKLLQDKGQLFICTDIGIFTYNLKSRKVKTEIPNQACKNIYKEGDSLIILNNVSVKYLNSQFKKSKEYFLVNRFYSHCIYLGQRLFGSEDRLFIERDSLMTYSLNQPFTYRIMDMKVHDSLLLIATTEKGFFIIRNHTILKNLNITNGLNSNNCSKIVPYKNELFIATNNGICRYNLFADITGRIMESDGLASNNVLDIALDNDTLYAGTDNGLSVIPLSSLAPKKAFNFFINPIVNNKDTLWDMVKLIKSRTDYPISLTLNAISLGVKGDVKYFYRIKERDTNYFQTADPAVFINFRNPGNYTFEAFSIDINGLKSEHAFLNFKIIPYWWQTNIFKFACILLLFVILFFCYKLIVHIAHKREQQRNETINRIRKLELDAWKSNINPHFLFNSFNTMQSLFSSNQFEKANRFVFDFSGLLRRTIDLSAKLLIPVKEEISYLENYLNVEKIKRHDRLDYEVTIQSASINDLFIPSLLVQPLVENSLKHGIKKQSHGIISISFSIVDSQLQVVITDNGIGLSDIQATYTSKGLNLIREKIRIVENISEQSISFLITNRTDEHGNCLGVIATLQFPMFTHDYAEVKI